MAKVLVSIKVYPEDADTDKSQLIEEIKKALPEGYELVRTSELPIAFGYVALKVHIAMPEETEGGTDKLEKLLSEIKGIQDIEVESVHRLSSF